MIKIHTGSEKLVIVLHEIYGVNVHMKEVCRSLSKEGFDVSCPNLLQQQTSFEYTQEAAAYRNFMENIGFADAATKVQKIVVDAQDKYKEIYLVGFSIGATIAWLCSETDCIKGVVGYYGSRIRDYLETNPRCSTLLFLSEQEQSSGVAESLFNKKNVELHQFSAEHGFSDPYSSKHHAPSRDEAYSKMLNFLLQP
ncbi:dienelactone hydrolase family protein [Planococcus sp. S3-L1]|uniref:dienelactone hydrolase family protein n=1 Tax=Planococcus sp. S3-L1 TaxID=3046200 RepID=UPI0024B8A87E|nr:dienelactone hydrolase family protein [Planococcus sp. S3-L1]MDJ0331575.1 dienelactone hydrolase family protein [Planococcus sp. S3-L1]